MNHRFSPYPSIETLAPFRRSHEYHAAIPAPVTGTLPDWLRGELVRTCPAVFETAGWHADHWFDGLGMIYAFRIGAAGIDFRSRLLESEAARDAWQGKARLGSFGTPTVRSLWRRIIEPVQRMSDNNNVNITPMGIDLVAMTEGSRQVVIDDATLAATEKALYVDDALGGAITTAHPHFDAVRNKVVNVATAFGIDGLISVFEHAPNARERKVIGSWRTSCIPYVHTFGLTPKNAILVVHPFVVKALDMLWSSKGYIDHFDWHPEQGTRLVVIDRASGVVREHLADAFFTFHTVNAFERGDETVLDLLAYPTADIVAALRVGRMVAQLPDLRPALLRIVMRPGVERAAVSKLSDTGFEFPAINYTRGSGQSYRFAYGAANGPRAGHAYASAIVKIDVQTGSAKSFSDAAYIFGEPVFVARPGADDEDDGVLLSVGSAREGDSALLAIIEPTTMTLLASATVPGAIPLGFHGSFVRKDA